MRRLIILFVLLFNISIAKSEFERLGDILTLAPIGMLIISLGMEDYEGAWQLAAGSVATQLTIEGIKRSFEYSHLLGNDFAFAKRPCCEDYKGFPSGHSGGAFSAAGYVYYRYGWKASLPLIGIGIVTAASRIDARKHTLLQAIAGGAIAWGFAYLFTTKYNPKPKILITPNVSYDNYGHDFYGINAYMKF